MADVTVIIVSFNTKELTLNALRSLFEEARNISLQVLVWDNASHDGSAEAISDAFPQAELVRHSENIGFGAAHNALTDKVRGEYLLLLNSDTQTRAGALNALLQFAQQNPQAGIVGGRTVFANGTLNPSSCWNRMTLWSLFCSAIGLTRAFPNTYLFNPEGIGGWRRNTVRTVDIVSGCFLMLRTELWRSLDGFSPRYFMYGEDADLCLRATQLGYQPMITPDAEITHLGGASVTHREEKLAQLLRAKASLIRDHWSAPLIPWGLAMLWLWSGVRRLGSQFSKANKANATMWNNLWRQRSEWLRGYS